MADIIEVLKAAGQDDLLKHLETLSGDARKNLERDIASQDWNELKALHAEKSAANLSDNVSADLQPMPFKIAADDLRYDFWKETGEILLGKGQVAAFLVAGGQGSRLGFEGQGHVRHRPPQPQESVPAAGRTSAELGSPGRPSHSLVHYD